MLCLLSYFPVLFFFFFFFLIHALEQVAEGSKKYDVVGRRYYAAALENDAPVAKAGMQFVRFERLVLRRSFFDTRNLDTPRWGRLSFETRIHDRIAALSYQDERG